MFVAVLGASSYTFAEVKESHYLSHSPLDELQTLRLAGMLKALVEQLKTPDIDSLGFEERLGLLVDREFSERDGKCLSGRLSLAPFSA